MQFVEFRIKHFRNSVLESLAASSMLKASKAVSIVCTIAAGKVYTNNTATNKAG
jgi:hypothetical protein